MWIRVEREQRLHQVRSLRPTKYTSINRRTGTQYILDPALAVFVADVDAPEQHAYVGIDVLEP